MDKGQFEDFLHFASKLTIVIPIIVIVVALIIKFNQSKTASVKEPSSKVLSSTKQNLTNIITGLNFNGPSACSYSSSVASVTAKIKNKRVSGEINMNGKTNNVIYTGDCIYVWEKNQFSGQKICGINTNLITNFLPQIQAMAGSIVNQTNITGFINSCKKQEVGEEVFKIPNNVLFKNTNLTSLL
jgi:hypothetical protein